MSVIKVVLNKNWLIVFVVMIVSCGVKSLTSDEYVEWIEDPDNGLNLTKEFQDVTFQILYKPVNYIIAKELKNGGINKTEIPSRILELDSLQYFTLRIKSNKSDELLRAGINSEDEYYQRLEYFMGPMQDDIKLIEGNDTIPCALFHYERSYGLAPYNNFVIAFSKSINNNEDKFFLFEDNILGTGNVMFKLNNSDLKNIPNIIWN